MIMSFPRLCSIHELLITNTQNLRISNKYIHTLLIGLYLVCQRMNVGSKFRFSCDYDLWLLEFEWDVPCLRPREGTFHILQWGKDALMVPQNPSYFSFFRTDMNKGFVKSCLVFHLRRNRAWQKVVVRLWT